MCAWVREHATEERKPKDTEEQFIYKARKKAIGPFKQKMWALGRDAPRHRTESRGAIHVPDDEAQIGDTAPVVSRVRARTSR
jgi:hypothetical protein